MSPRPRSRADLPPVSPLLIAAAGAVVLGVAQPRGLRCKHVGWDCCVLGSHAVAIERRERIYLVTAADDDA